MNGKQQNLTPQSLVIGSLVAASASFGAIVAAPLSAKAQNSPVLPTSPVNIPTTVLDFTNLFGGTETSTQTTTSTTQQGTTTTTTTTTTSTQTTSTTQSSSTQETTQVSTGSTGEVVSGSSTSEISTQGQQITNVSTGLEATTSVTSQTTTSTQSGQTVAVVISLSQQYATATGMDAAFIGELASLLGIDGDTLVATLIFERARGLQGNRQAAMQAFINALKRAGVFGKDAFNNEAFAELFGSYATAEELAAIFNSLSDIRIRFLALSAKFFANNGFGFRLAQKNISFAQYLVYKHTRYRAITFPRARGDNNRRDDD